MDITKATSHAHGILLSAAAVFTLLHEARRASEAGEPAEPPDIEELTEAAQEYTDLAQQDLNDLRAELAKDPRHLVERRQRP